MIQTIKVTILTSIMIISACGGGSTKSNYSSSQNSTTTSVSSSSASSAPTTNISGRAINTSIDAPLASLNPNTNALHYGYYSNRLEANTVNIIPDFSYAGYQGGGVALPASSSITNHITLSPTTGDNYAQIQAAIDTVSALPLNEQGIRGAILLTAGTYPVSAELKIQASGVILRGEGQGTSGTIIEASSTEYRNTLISVTGHGRGRIPFAATQAATTNITSPYVAVGSRSFTVASSAGYAVGDLIGIKRTPNAAWVGVNGLNTAQYDWDETTYHLVFARTITAITDNTLTIDIPLVDSITESFGGGEVYRLDVSARLQQVGIENLRIRTLTREDISDENRGFHGITLRETENSWIRDVTVEYFSHAITFNYGTRFITAQDIAFVDPNFTVTGGRNYGFNLNAGALNLFQRCYARNVRHSFVSGSRVTGPNVFLDCSAVSATNDSGPHQRWATGTLFDNTEGWRLFVQNRTTSGTGHGWAGAQQMFWNTAHDEYVVQAPPFAMNWAVGNEGTLLSGIFANEPQGIIEAHGNAVTPRSLYLQQLQDRLGEDAVNQVTTQAQREGRIWEALKTWQGEYKRNETE